MNTKVDLENELVNNLQELTTAEQDELRVVSSVYMAEYERLKVDKIKSSIFSYFFKKSPICFLYKSGFFP